MSRTVSFHRLARQELKEAAHYYDSESPGLGPEFLKEIEHCLRSILDYPEAAPVLVGVFPMPCCISIKPARIRVLAVMNLRRRPMYWVGRE